MVCYNCSKASSCKMFRELYTMSNDFCINDCREFDEVSKYKYRKIAERDDLMHLIYDYFTNQIEGNYGEEEVKKAIVSALLDL